MAKKIIALPKEYMHMACWDRGQSSVVFNS